MCQVRFSVSSQGLKIGLGFQMSEVGGYGFKLKSEARVRVLNNV